MSSIHRRLGIGLAAGIACLWLLATMGAGLILRYELGEAADSSLQVTARQLLAIVPAENDFATVPDVVNETLTSTVDPGTEPVVVDASAPAEAVDISSKELHRMEEVESLLGYVIRNSAGTNLYTGGTLHTTFLLQKFPQGFSSIEGHRVYVERSDSLQRSILIAEPLHHRNEISREAMTILSSSLLMLIPLSLVLVWWVVRASLRDVRYAQLQIESRGGNDLTAVGTDNVPRELVPIVESVNRLLGRLSRTLESERNFTTNSAHELRTPIASALAQTQRQIATLPDGTERERSRHIEQTLQELARTSEKLMQLARAESGSMINHVPDNVYPVIEYLLDEFQSLHREDNRLALHCLAEAQFTTVLDTDGVAILLRNLIDNALKHGTPGSTVDIIVDSQRNEVRVVNDGPVIPATELRVLTERFKRSSPGPMGVGPAESAVVGPAGSGLGLAIADTIARHAGMILQLQSPASGRAGGFEATLSTG